MTGVQTCALPIFQTELYSDPLNKSLHSHTYHSFHPEDIVFSSSGTNAPHTWQGTNIANPEYDHECMRRAMENAITSAHLTASHTPSATILILPRWEHTPYRHSKYINSPSRKTYPTVTKDSKNIQSTTKVLLHHITGMGRQFE